jgi:ABC-type phosphate transport system substrate-binding protein
VILLILALRFFPEFRSFLIRHGDQESQPNRLILAGLDLAPVLIPRLADAYSRLYPEQELRIRTGGTRQALEDLFNRRADVAFLSRALTAEEEAVVRSIGDTALAFPIALGAIALLTSKQTAVDSIPVGDLRKWLSAQGETGGGARFEDRIYAPDPNLGLWNALTDQLGLSERLDRNVIWLASDHQVAEAVGNDPGSIGFASLLALPEDLSRFGVRTIRVTGTPEERAVTPVSEEVATGEYPLHHYLYVACRPRGGALASGFVSFLHSGRGQRLVAREGFLPARAVPREIHLTSEPVGKAG